VHQHSVLQGAEHHLNPRSCSTWHQKDLYSTACACYDIQRVLTKTRTSACACKHCCTRYCPDPVTRETRLNPVSGTPKVMANHRGLTAQQSCYLAHGCANRTPALIIYISCLLKPLLEICSEIIWHVRLLCPLLRFELC
jgi:hypothetical protein